MKFNIAKMGRVVNLKRIFSSSSKVHHSSLRGADFALHVLVSVSFLSITPFLSADPIPQEQTYSLQNKKIISIPARQAHLPLYIYGDESGKQSNYVASGYMGDADSLSIITITSDATAPVSTGRTGKTSLRIQYSGKGKQGWAGIYWLSPANNWGNIKGAGFDLSGATKLTFWIRGEKGGERISSCRVGGVNGAYPDTDIALIGPLTLTKNWKQYTIDLKDKDLRHIVGGFSVGLRRVDNLHGATFYLDEVIFVGKNLDEKKHQEDLAQEKTEQPKEKNVVEPQSFKIEEVSVEENIPTKEPKLIKKDEPVRPPKVDKKIQPVVVKTKEVKVVQPEKTPVQMANIPLNTFPSAVESSVPPVVPGKSGEKGFFKKTWQDWIQSSKTDTAKKTFGYLEKVSGTQSPVEWVGKVCSPFLPVTAGKETGALVEGKK